MSLSCGQTRIPVQKGPGGETLHFVSESSRLDGDHHLPSSLQKERTATYRRRWFVLKANLLFYQEQPADRHLLGLIVLEGCAVRCCQDDDGHFAFCLEFQGAGLRSYRLAASDGPTRESWVRTLQVASHCHLSLLLRHLRDQYQGVSRCVVGHHLCRPIIS